MTSSWFSDSSSSSRQNNNSYYGIDGIDLDSNNDGEGIVLNLVSFKNFFDRRVFCVTTGKYEDLFKDTDDFDERKNKTDPTRRNDNSFKYFGDDSYEKMVTVSKEKEELRNFLITPNREVLHVGGDTGKYLTAIVGRQGGGGGDDDQNDNILHQLRFEVFDSLSHKKRLTKKCGGKGGEKFVVRAPEGMYISNFRLQKARNPESGKQYISDCVDIRLKFLPRNICENLGVDEQKLRKQEKLLKTKFRSSHRNYHQEEEEQEIFLRKTTRRISKEGEDAEDDKETNKLEQERNEQISSSENDEKVATKVAKFIENKAPGLLESLGLDTTDIHYISRVVTGDTSYEEQSDSFVFAIGVMITGFALAMISINERRAVKQDQVNEYCEDRCVSPHDACYNNYRDVITDSEFDNTILSAHGLLVPELDWPVDKTLGVVAPHYLSISRSVEMYQWHETEHKHRHEHKNSKGKVTSVTYTYTYSYSKIWSSHHQSCPHSPVLHSNPSFPSIPGSPDNPDKIFLHVDGYPSRYNSQQVIDSWRDAFSSSSSSSKTSKTNEKNEEESSSSSSSVNTFDVKQNDLIHSQNKHKFHPQIDHQLKLQLSSNFQQRIPGKDSRIKIISSDDGEKASNYDLEFHSDLLYSKNGGSNSSPKLGDVRVDYAGTPDGDATCLGKYTIYHGIEPFTTKLNSPLHEESPLQYPWESKNNHHQNDDGSKNIGGGGEENSTTVAGSVLSSRLKFLSKSRTKQIEVAAQASASSAEKFVLSIAPLEFAWLSRGRYSKNESFCKNQEQCNRTTNFIFSVAALMFAGGLLLTDPMTCFETLAFGVSPFTVAAAFPLSYTTRVRARNQALAVGSRRLRAGSSSEIGTGVDATFDGQIEDAPRRSHDRKIQSPEEALKEMGSEKVTRKAEEGVAVAAGAGARGEAAKSFFREAVKKGFRGLIK